MRNRSQLFDIGDIYNSSYDFLAQKRAKVESRKIASLRLWCIVAEGVKSCVAFSHYAARIVCRVSRQE